MRSSQKPGDRSTHLLVRAGELVCGVPVERVRKVVSSMSLWPVAGYAPGLVGLGRFGGEPLAVLSLETLATKQPQRWRSRSPVVVVHLAGSDDLGLAIDEAFDVVDLGDPCGATSDDGVMVERSTADGRVAWCVDLVFLERKKT